MGTESRVKIFIPNYLYSRYFVNAVFMVILEEINTNIHEKSDGTIFAEEF